MSAVLTRRRRSGRGRERDHRQPSLFSQVLAPAPRPDEPRAVALAVPVREPEVPAVAPAGAQVDARDDAPALAARTLDDAISALWGELITGETADCPVCGSAMAPRHSAGPGVVGGRCGSCASTLA